MHDAIELSRQENQKDLPVPVVFPAIQPLFPSRQAAWEALIESVESALAECKQPPAELTFLRSVRMLWAVYRRYAPA